MSKIIDITGIDKAVVLAALYNAAISPGHAALDRRAEDMTVEKANELLATGETYFDYVGGRLLKVDLSTNSLDPWLYDRDNGAGAAETAIIAAML